ncbi:hypothetical protein AYY18_19325 [Morganella psychrotolerans]|uniref:Uncharacterized protein n=1 Tax=Morganella psychrotolerans TaxID=368603 RepID=A0A1B8HKP5_9GAMM|nr:hypothetical protein AYY18_19325 [Morganella psychrotolerans]
MKRYNIEARRNGEACIVNVSGGTLHAELKCVGELRSISVTGRGNVRQIKAIAKIFQKTVNA